MYLFIDFSQSLKLEKPKPVFNFYMIYQQNVGR